MTGRGREVLDALARELCRACRRMAGEGLIAGRAGNLSLRRDDTVLVTPPRRQQGAAAPLPGRGHAAR